MIEGTSARVPGFASSAVKLTGAANTQVSRELLLDAMGVSGIGWSGEAFADDDLKTTRDWLREKALTIAGGTLEVQLNIISKRVLGLPD